MSNLSKDQELTIKTFLLSMAEAGQVTLPQEVLDSLQVSPENSLLLLQIGEFVLLVPRQPQVSSLADRFVSQMNTNQVSLEDLLEGLQEERQTIWEEYKHRD
ncbi:MAG: hypothetical protein RIE73_29840 [Coleofasciculus sp. C1-SOL-03]|uniref:AbrB/MazE/SpoVT family DNA-binding domain-containing protein n=1 Tax=Coleofasciculus sp. C1-SOL-03 TaxID=3069522 RepID=UPI003302302E